MVPSPTWEANWFAASQEIPAFYGTRRFITALTSVRHLSLSWSSPIQSIYPHPTSWRSILILSTHLRLGLHNGLFPSGFPTKLSKNTKLKRRTPVAKLEVTSPNSTLLCAFTAECWDWSTRNVGLWRPEFRNASLYLRNTDSTYRKVTVLSVFRNSDLNNTAKLHWGWD